MLNDIQIVALFLMGVLGLFRTRFDMTISDFIIFIMSALVTVYGYYICILVDILNKSIVSSN